MSAHVVPRDDLAEHELTADCPCGPDIDTSDDGDLWVHHSIDGREADERASSD